MSTHTNPKSKIENRKCSVWRLLDANANRAREGLRVLEDTARFAMNHPEAASALRLMRHRLDETVRRYDGELLRHRDAERDVGRENPTARYRAGVQAIIRSNFKRCGEALRVLEEYGRVMSPKAVKDIQALRYQVYQWEKKLSGGERGQTRPPHRSAGERLMRGARV